ncbi:hypothetical protein EWM64_g6566 [Hericium alpestre]|uniref:Uncharacterized protein n=1 Tax=Hericium alpestre TaxID=135208 RepID=A0A4Y9ZS95_9AGAM|nr:hypothetical protein EWM64_g6566 [Hericium alpestre]
MGKQKKGHSARIQNLPNSKKRKADATKEELGDTLGEKENIPPEDCANKRVRTQEASTEHGGGEAPEIGTTVNVPDDGQDMMSLTGIFGGRNSSVVLRDSNGSANERGDISMDVLYALDDDLTRSVENSWADTLGHIDTPQSPVDDVLMHDVDSGSAQGDLGMSAWDDTIKEADGTVNVLDDGSARVWDDVASGAEDKTTAGDVPKMDNAGVDRWGEAILPGTAQGDAERKISISIDPRFSTFGSDHQEMILNELTFPFGTPIDPQGNSTRSSAGSAVVSKVLTAALVDHIEEWHAALIAAEQVGDPDLGHWEGQEVSTMFCLSCEISSPVRQDSDMSWVERAGDWTVPSNDEEEDMWLHAGDAFESAASCLDGMNRVVWAMGMLLQDEKEVDDDVNQNRNRDVLDHAASALTVASAFDDTEEAYLEVGGLEQVVDAFEKGAHAFHQLGTGLRQFTNEHNPSDRFLQIFQLGDVFEDAANAFESTVFAMSAVPAFLEAARGDAEGDDVPVLVWEKIETSRAAFACATRLFGRVADAYLSETNDDQEEDQIILSEYAASPADSALLQIESDTNSDLRASTVAETDVNVEVESLEGDTHLTVELDRTDQAMTVLLRPSPTSPPIPAPSKAECADACEHVALILRPPRDSGIGHKPFGGDELLRSRLSMMEMLLRAYSKPAIIKGLSEVGWIESSLDVARLHGKAEHTAKRLRQWARAFLLDPNNLPQNPYGKWKKSMLVNEDFADDLRLHLQLVGKYVSAKDVVAFTQCEEIQEPNDRRDLRWVNVDEKPVPRAKTEGATLMIADFVSADHGWLRSPDGQESTRVLWKTGGARDGYFTNDEILEQVTKAMDILDKHYSHERHVFIFDNATTHRKWPDDSLSARNMSKKPTQPGKPAFGVWRMKMGPDGKPIYKPNGKVEKEKIPMADARFRDGKPQPLYFPDGHPQAGVFKGMAQILIVLRTVRFIS